VRLLERARGGDAQALGKLLDSYRPYLSLLARLKSDRQLRAKVDDSDLVQDVCLSAHRDFAQFRGETEPELTAWLREIMAHAAANLGRDHRRQRRDVTLERRLGKPRSARWPTTSTPLSMSRGEFRIGKEANVRRRISPSGRPAP
jgi:RNA polymerase sigma-70 factor (ECF subfamily)